LWTAFFQTIRNGRHTESQALLIGKQHEQKVSVRHRIAQSAWGL